MNHHAYYPLLRLGSLATVWTTHITPFVATENESASSFSASSPSSMLRLYTSIFPERERGSHVQIHADENAENGLRCRKPLSTGSSGVDGVDVGKDLMTLAAFANGGYRAADAKVLVCVKSVGVKKKGMFSRKITTERYVFADLPGHLVTRKDGTTAETATIHLLDHTTASISASLNLWGAAAASAATWIPHKTILLLTRPGYRVSKNTNNANAANNNNNSGNAPLSLLSPPSDGPSYIYLSLTANTLVEIDPAPLRDATWLRGYAQRLLKKRPLPTSSSSASPSSLSSSARLQTSPDGASTHPFPPLAAVEAADQRILYTLADIDEFARKAVVERSKNGDGGARAQQQYPPKLQLVGFASVVITEVNLVKLFRRGALACGQCAKCGGAVYANDVVGRCGWCCSDDDGSATSATINGGNRDGGEAEEETDGAAAADTAAVPLELNPQALGPVLDETGMMATGRLAMSMQAWEQLFGRSMEELVGEQDVEALRALEARMAWVRVSLVVGWMEGWGVGGADEGGWEGVGRLFVLGVRE